MRSATPLIEALEDRRLVANCMWCFSLASPSLARLARQTCGSALLVLAALLGGTVASAAPLKVMPLGDSITEGDSLPAGVYAPGGYREYLYQDLVAAGYPAIQYIGTSTTNPGLTLTATGQTNHEGHPGWKINNIDANLDGQQLLDVYGTMQDGGGHFFQRAGNPDVVLLHLGTNDLLSAYDPAGDPGTEGDAAFVSHMADRMDHLLSTIYSNGRNPHVFVGMIPIAWVNSAFADGRVPLFNAELRDNLVPKYAAMGRDITYVDLYTLFTIQDNSTGVFQINPALYADGASAVHPNAAGYKVMADAWSSAMTASVPEPSTAAGACTAAVALVGRRRRPTNDSNARKPGQRVE